MSVKKGQEVSLPAVKSEMKLNPAVAERYSRLFHTTLLGYAANPQIPAAAKIEELAEGAALRALESGLDLHPSEREA